MILGFLLPPLAVAVRFGIGRDFFINCVCTLCGYIPGHVSMQQARDDESWLQIDLLGFRFSFPGS